MENFNNDVFEFGSNQDELNQNNNFNYNEISGLGESNYENEDLFKIEDGNQKYDVDSSNDLNFGVSDFDLPQTFDNSYETEVEDSTDIQDDFATSTFENELLAEEEQDETETSATQSEVNSEEVPTVEDISVIEDDNLGEFENTSEDNDEFKETNEVATVNPEIYDDNKIKISDTSNEELEKLIEYKDEKIESTDINQLFDKVSSNFKDASEIFKKNTEMKEKIDLRFNELKRLQSEIENSKQNQINEINAYKEEVISKLTDKKEEIEKRLNSLKELQSSLEKEKMEFEEYKKQEKAKIEKVQKDVQEAYDDRRNELNKVEDALRKQKDALDEGRNQLSLDRIKYESDKNDLANNLLKFNELVNSFTTDVNSVKE